MKDYVFPAHNTRLLAFIHIGGVGLAANRLLGGGLHDLRIIDVDRTADAIKQNRDFFFGVKVRMHLDAVTHWDADQAMKKARAAADQSGTKLMVHVSGTPIPLPQILEYLGPGDISTHAFNGYPESILDNNDKIRPEVKAAVERGVIMDVGHAGVHCDVTVVKAAMAQGMFPDTISTDIHIPPPGRTVYLMNDLVSKFHAMGLSLEDAVTASTSRPAQVLGLEDSLGSLAPGRVGDAAVYDLREGRFVWHDMAGHNVEGKVKLDTFLTVRAGQVAWREGHLTQIGQC
jgi:dihydroorotase